MDTLGDLLKTAFYRVIFVLIIGISQGVSSYSLIGLQNLLFLTNYRRKEDVFNS